MANETKLPPKDPIVDRSLSGTFLVVTALLVISVVWMIVDEVVTRRPYKAWQTRFVEAAQIKAAVDARYLQAEVQAQQDSAAYADAKAELAGAQAELAANKAEIAALAKKKQEIQIELNLVRGQYQVERGKYQPRVYRYEQAGYYGEKDAAAAELKAIKHAEPEIAKVFKKFLDLTRQKSDIEAKIQALQQPVSDARRKVAQAAPSAAKLQKAKSDKDGFGWFIDVKQFYNEDLGIVDRCHSCHAGIDRPGFERASWERAEAQLDKKLGKGAGELAARVFSTHPGFGRTLAGDFDAFEKHPVKKFGCTSCHLGNGPGTVEDKAHGLKGPPRESWLEPLHHELHPMLPTRSAHLGKMFEAACAECHDQQLYLQGAEQLTLGRELVEDVGCVGCHKIAGFRLNDQEIEDIRNQVAKVVRPRLTKLRKQLDDAEDPGAVKREIVALGRQLEEANARLQELDREVKCIGPDLNRDGQAGLRAKIYPRWLPRWIGNPQKFRHSTRMPNFLLAENADPQQDEVLQVAAYIWQQAKGTPTTEETPRTFPKATVDEGRWLTQTVGCTACHAFTATGGYDDVDPLRPKELDATPERFELYDLRRFWHDKDAKLETEKKLEKPDRAKLVRRGPTFGPALDRVGEKVRYEWAVAWLQSPRGLQPHSSMPNLRLSQDEAEKIAAYLTTLRKDRPGGDEYKDVEMKWLNDPGLATKGLRHVLRYGCYNCHQIDLRKPPISEAELKQDRSLTQKPFSSWKPYRGAPAKIGVELSGHGSKPLAQFDFGLHHDDVPHYRPAWLESKILEPRRWDTGRYKPLPQDRLRMPRFGFQAEEAQAITTVLTGLVEDKVPAKYLYRPGRRGLAIIAGERIVKKYNCRSCHIIDDRGGWGHEAIQAQVTAALADEATTERIFAARKLGKPIETKYYLPPTLNREGLRARPKWLFHFLKDPASVETAGRIRPFHLLRMPTFELTDHEAQTLVDYFDALDEDLLAPYPENPDPDETLVARGRTLFGPKECYKCHNVGSWESEQRLGPNFQITRARNRTAWLHTMIPDPQTFIPGTKMTSFYDETPFATLRPERRGEVIALSAYIRALADPAFREKEGFVAGRTPSVIPKKSK